MLRIILYYFITFCCRCWLPSASFVFLLFLFRSRSYENYQCIGGHEIYIISRGAIPGRSSFCSCFKLHLLNNKSVRELADRVAERVEAEVGGDAKLQVVRVYRVALGRAPGDEELAATVPVLEQLRREWATKLKNDQVAARTRALGNLCHAVMNSAAFVYLD